MMLSYTGGTETDVITGYELLKKNKREFERDEPTK